MSEDRNHFHGMKNHPPHGMAMNGRDQPTISRCVCQIRNPRVGQVDNDWIWLVNDDYLMISWMMMIIIHDYYWWMMMSTASYFSSRRRWFFGAWRCSRSLGQGHRSLDVEHEPRAAEHNHLWISAPQSFSTISTISSRVPPYNTLQNSRVDVSGNSSKSCLLWILTVLFQIALNLSCFTVLTPEPFQA